MTHEKWQIDSSHSGILFSVRHMVIARVRGQFSRWSGTVSAEDGDLSHATVDVVIDASSIDTGVADRDAHLKSADFLDVSHHPDITFHTTATDDLGEGRLRVAGDLTIRGVTRPVTLEVEFVGRAKDPWGNERAGFNAKAAIDRKDFGLTWNQVLEAGGVLVGDRVDIEIEVEAVRQQASQAA